MRHKKVQYLVVCIVILLGNSRKVSSLTEEIKSIDACLDAFKGWKVCKIKSILTLMWKINSFIIKESILQSIFNSGSSEHSFQKLPSKL